MMINWDNTRVRVQTAGLYQWRKGQRHEKSWHGVLQCQVLWLCMGGKAVMHLHQGNISIAPGVMLWLRPGWHYVCEQDPDDPVRHYAVYFNLMEENGQVRQPNKPLPPELLVNADIDFTVAVIRRLMGPVPPNTAQFSFHAPDRVASVTLFRGLLMELDTSNAEENLLPNSEVSIADSRLEITQIAAEIAQSPADIPPISDLAERCHMSPSHFCQCFIRMFGHTPQKYLIMWRIRHGQRLLVETELSVKQIAAYIGYTNPHFFSRQFKQITRQTPLEYRAANRGKLSVGV